MDNTLSHHEHTGATVSHDSTPSLGILIAGMQILLLHTEKLKEDRYLATSPSLLAPSIWLV